MIQNILSFAEPGNKELIPLIGATLADIKRWGIERALAIESGNKPRAAARLGISLKTLYNHLNQWEQVNRGGTHGEGNTDGRQPG